jgi:hypothetical protein
MCTNIELIQHIDVYYVDNTRRIIVFEKGVNQKCDIIMKKRILTKPIWIDSHTIKMKLCSEDPVAPSHSQIKLIRIKQRVRFVMNDKFDVELDLIRNVDPNNATTLKAIKDRLFGVAGVDQFDELKIETEFKQGDINLNDVQRSIDIVKAAIG